MALSCHPWRGGDIFFDEQFLMMTVLNVNPLKYRYRNLETVVQTINQYFLYTKYCAYVNLLIINACKLTLDLTIKCLMSE